MSTKPIILVTNDDSISAPGIKALREVASEFGSVVVVAPDKPQSGMGHAITINQMIRANKTQYHEGAEEYAISGTPVDCVKMAVNYLMPRKPDLIVSGINHGSNASVNVIYSGTMSAAVEGAMEGIPSIGFSLLDYSVEADFEASKKFVRSIIATVLSKGLPEGVCLNVNIPKLPEELLKGVKVCRQACGNWVETFEERQDPYGKPYYWLAGEFTNYEPDATDTDLYALENGYISIVPIQFDLTAHKSLETIQSFFKS
jgi:5'-nucleotidase